LDNYKDKAKEDLDYAQCEKRKVSKNTKTRRERYVMYCLNKVKKAGPSTHHDSGQE